MQITFVKEDVSKAKAIAVSVLKGGSLSDQAKAIDKASKGMLQRALKSAQHKGEQGKVLVVRSAADWDVVVLIGLGDVKKFSEQDAMNLGGKAAKALDGARATTAALALYSTKIKVPEAAFTAAVAMGARLASYRFDKYHTKLTDDQKPTLHKMSVMSSSAAKAKTAYADLEKIADGVELTRDLVSEPANIIYPKTLAAKCSELKKLGVKVEVLGEAQMEKLGMGALLGVGQGSAFESQLVVMQWNGAAKSKKPVAFVGKGVTFDTGGISIKPSGGMEDMKWDMGGSAVVIGVMKALAGRKAKVNAVGVVGLVENMPSSTAQRPGDVVTSMSGQTIEVLNTDAEGRLVLADALWYTQDRFKPQWIIDLATLTGAIVVALGSLRAGLFSNNDVLSKRLHEIGEELEEPVWRLPVEDYYDKQINSDIADMQNIGREREAGSITAAQFLQRFVNKTPWVHLDIAGVAWSKKDRDITPRGGTGYGVRLLDRLVSRHYEK